MNPTTSGFLDGLRAIPSWLLGEDRDWDAERVVWVGVVCIAAVAGIFLRLDGIDASLWLDEFGTLWTVEGSLATTWERATSFQGQTPFYYLFAWVSLQLFGESEIALRIPSLLAGLATWGVIGIGAARIFGPAAGRFAFLLAAFDVTLIRVGADARPYSLALLCLAVATVGFLRAVTRDDRAGRVLWVVGGACTAWAHYLMFPIILGLHATYLLIPGLRKRYRFRAYLRDLAAQAILVALTLPQLLALFLRRESLDWLGNDIQVTFLLLLALPYGLALGLGLTRYRPRDPDLRMAQVALWLSVPFTLALIAASRFLGVELFHWRYVQGILIPVLFLAASALGRMTGVTLLLTVTGTALVMAIGLQAAKEGTGTFTRAGGEGWREAVSVLNSELGAESPVPVLFRSRFVEEDLLPIGSPPPVTRAPLRSPGQTAPDWQIVQLTYRWSHPERAEYFDREVTPKLSEADVLYLLSRSDDYTAAVIDWVSDTWPGRYRVSSREFGAVCLVRFVRDSKPDANARETGSCP